MSYRSSPIPCEVPECGRNVVASGLCHAHWRRRHKYGDVQAHIPVQTKLIGVPIEDRLMLHTEPQGSCVVWTGPVNEHGYGYTNWDGKRWFTHRASWVLANGPIPEGFVLDHLCRVRNCLNPSHLEVVTQAVNTIRGQGLAAARLVNFNKDTCRPGLHPWPESMVVRGNGSRECRECKRASQRRADEKRRGKRRTRRDRNSSD